MTMKIYLFIFAVLLYSCTGDTQKNEPNNPTSTETKSVKTNKNTDQKYAVVWKWATDDVKKITNLSPKISIELTELWKKGDIENAYYDHNPKENKLDHFPNITYFISAKDQSAAQAILDKLIVVQENIATYSLFPVGKLWLDRNKEGIDKLGIHTSYVSVWTTKKSPLHGDGADELLRKQNDAIVHLWENGRIENVYFDVEGTYEPNDKTDFVFFINSDSEKGASKICESLPFYKNGIATYKIHQVGTHWLGIND